ncbi:hypothetical protein F5B20DRAFT_577021 [Whalleya microplaca]|nr:hypothetical protein F5B20DRAFT_577021 [Whalleya microplaca]
MSADYYVMESPRPMSPIRYVAPAELPDTYDFAEWDSFRAEHHRSENFTSSILIRLPELVRKLPVLILCFAEEPWAANDRLITDLWLMLMSGKIIYFAPGYYRELASFWMKGLAIKAQGPNPAALYKKIATQSAPFIARLDPSPFDPPPRRHDRENEIAIRLYNFMCHEHSILEEKGVIRSTGKFMLPTNGHGQHDENKPFYNPYTEPASTILPSQGPPIDSFNPTHKLPKPIVPYNPQVEAMKDRLQKAQENGKPIEQFEWEYNNIKRLARELMEMRPPGIDLKRLSFPFN